MSTECKVVAHFQQVILLFGILQSVSVSRWANTRTTYPAFEIFQDFDLDHGLIVETLLVTDDLDSNHVASLMIATSQNLSERALAESIDDFVSKRNMIAFDYEVVSSLVIVSEVLCGRSAVCHVLLSSVSGEEDVLVFINFLLLIIAELISVSVKRGCTSMRLSNSGLCKCRPSHRQAPRQQRVRLAPGNRTFAQSRDSVCHLPPSSLFAFARNRTFPHRP